MQISPATLDEQDSKMWVSPVPGRILLTEDDRDLRDAVQDLLEDLGCDVVPAGNGRQALEFLSSPGPSGLPDIVILDLKMPLVNGWKVLEVLQRDPILARIPVVVISSASDDRPTGVAAFLLKPFRMETLLDTVERLRQQVA